VQIDDSGDDFHCTGVFYSMIRPRHAPNKPVGEWNTRDHEKAPHIVKLTVRCDGLRRRSAVPAEEGQFEPVRESTPGHRATSGLQHHGGNPNRVVQGIRRNTRK